MANFPEPILYQSADGTVTLIDIPTSIAAAQGTPDCPNEKTLLSSEPQEQPFVTNEPRSEKARQKLQANTVDAELHEEYRTLIEAGLDDIRAHHTGRWCFPRTVLPETKQTRVRKRKIDLDFDSRSMEDEKQPSNVFPFDAQQEWHINTSTSHDDCNTPPDNPGENDSATASQTTSPRPWNNSHHNTNAHPTTFTLSAAHSPSTYTFALPPHSSFHLGPLPHPPSPQPHPFPPLPTSTTSPTFPTILLDPPYPNRSARRASPYTTLPTLPSLTTLLTALALPSLLQQQRGGHIAIWTTNRPAFRALLLAPTTGLFARWGVRLVEEWVWVKVTAAGEPVTPLGGLWRKPYEVLLVGSADARGVGEEGEESGPPVKRRVLAAVPDLHSRKPCLKELFERFLGRGGERGDGEGKGEQEGQGQEQAVLEIFARHLVAGWCSWGDEVIKFNRDIWWT